MAWTLRLADWQGVFGHVSAAVVYTKTPADTLEGATAEDDRHWLSAADAGTWRPEPL